MTTTKVQAYAAQSASSALAPLGIARRDSGPLDVEIEILYCGVCHCAPPVRRHHDLLTTAPLEGGSRTKGWHRRARRVGSHGGEICPCLWRSRRLVHNLSQQNRRWPATWRP